MAETERRAGRPARQAAGAVCIALLLASCSGSSNDSPPATTANVVSPSVAPTTVPPTTPDATTSAVLNSYRNYWAARVSAQASPDKSLPAGLTRYGTGSAVADVRATVLLFRKQGIVMRGSPSLSPAVTASDAKTATITDCVDSSQWQPIYAASGKSALAPGQSPRVVVTSTALLGDKGWVISTAVADRDRTC